MHIVLLRYWRSCTYYFACLLSLYQLVGIFLTSHYSATFMFIEAVSSWWFMPRLRHCNCMFATLVIVHVSVRVATWTCCRYNAVDAAFPSLDTALVMRLLKSHGSVVARYLQLQNLFCCSCDFFVVIWLVFAVYLRPPASSVVYSCWICSVLVLCLRPLISVFVVVFLIQKSIGVRCSLSDAYSL